MVKEYRKIVMQVFVIICIVGLMAPVYADTKAPSAVVDSTAFEFGDRFEGIDVIHDFVVKNTGDADLEITSVKAG